jgi:hypothetical protein
MKTLHLTLKKKWFDMILAGEKKEEYREIKPYWWNRLEYPFSTMKIKYDTVTFRNGYSKDARKMVVECVGVERGNAKPEWSDNWQGEVFIIKLGNIIK